MHRSEKFRRRVAANSRLDQDAPRFLEPWRLRANDPRESSPHAWVFLNSRGARRRSARISVRFVGR